MVAFFVDQVVFMWSVLPMGSEWIFANSAPVVLNMIISFVLLVVYPEEDDTKDKNKKND